MSSVVVYSPRQSARLTWILDWLLTERLQLTYTLTDSMPESGSSWPLITYGSTHPGAISVPGAGLLWQQGIAETPITMGSWDDTPVLFANEGDTTLPFDIFSAAFYLLSRYEEYLPFTPDKHGRYPATDSILYRKGMLRRPVVDEWVARFCKVLNAAGINAKLPEFSYQPTYDIDIAWSFLHKGPARTLGGYLRAAARLDFRQLRERIDVARRRQKDPYDSFRWLRQVHRQYGYRPQYFILCALNATAFDKNIPPNHPAMARAIKGMAREAEVGIHPSYYATTPAMLGAEKKALEAASGQVVTISRQHYIKVTLPHTYRLLLQHGITHDHSMGYGAQLGFRAGTSAAFTWYDLEAEQATALRVHPFCFMDTTAHYERKYPPAKAFEKLRQMTAHLQECGGTLTTIFHNFSLGTAREWKGWKQRYEEFLREVSHDDGL